MNAFIRRLLALSMLWSASVLASTVHRCEGPNGRITFTDLGCSEGARMSLQQAYNPPPGGGQAGLLPEREYQPRRRAEASQGARVTIVDSREIRPSVKPHSKSKTAKNPR